MSRIRLEGEGPALAARRLEAVQNEAADLLSDAPMECAQEGIALLHVRHH